MKRKCVALDSNGYAHVEEGDVPELQPGQVLVEVHASLVSPGTELGSARRKREEGKKDPNPSKRPFGYQNAGVVIEKTDGCDEYEIGQRVACMGGGYAMHTDKATVPINLTTPLPENVSFDEGAFNHLAATALWAVRRSQPEFGQNVAVVGLGIVGQCASQFLRCCGCHVIGLDRLPMRIDVARKNGIDIAINTANDDPIPIVKDFTRGYGIDAAIICFGGEATGVLDQLYQMFKTTLDGHKYGNVTIVGGASISKTFASGLGNLDIRSSARTGPGYHDEAWEHGAAYPPVVVGWNTRRNIEECVRAMSEKKVNVESLITHRLPIDDAPKGCDDLIENPNSALGVVILPQE